MSELIVLDRTIFAAEDLPCPFGKDSMVQFCLKERIPIQLYVTRGKGRAPIILASDWQQYLKTLRSKAKIPELHNGHSGESELNAQILRRLTRIEEVVELLYAELSGKPQQR